MVTCVQSQSGFEVVCCSQSEELQRNFEVKYLLDPCKYKLNIGIENIEVEKELLGYQWGKL